MIDTELRARASVEFTGPDRRPPFTRLLRLHLTYLWCHCRPLSLGAPHRFTELVQRRKLIDHDQRMARFIDKVAVKRFVADALGTDWVTPTLWEGTVLPLRPEWAYPFVVKSRHGCHQCRFVRDGAQDWNAIRRASASWMRNAYGHWLDERGYRGVPRGLLVEPFVGDGTTLPIDYKLFVFDGQVAFIQVHLERETAHRWIVLDRNWRQRTPSNDAPTCPESMPAMIRAAEALGRDFDFVRVDFYDVAGQPRFGEMTFYPGSGLCRLDPPELDLEMGALWRSAIVRRGG